MKIQKQTLKHPYIILCSILIVVILLGFIWYFFINTQSGQNSTTLNESEANTKKSFIENTDANGNSKTNNEDSSINENDGFDFSLDDTGDSITVSVEIYSISSGTCKLTVGSYVVEAAVLYQPQYSTCEGFSVDKNDIDLDSTFVLTITDGSKTIEKTKKLEG